MTRAEAFDKAWRIGAKEKDFSFVDEIYHAAAYKHVNFGEENSNSMIKNNVFTV